MQRREFLAASAATLLAASASGEETPAPKIVDCHTHFYDPTRTQGVPWPGKDDDLLYRPVLPPDFKKFAQPQGVVGTVVVEASAWVEDNQWLLDLAERDPFLLGIVGNLNPNADDFERHVQRFAKNPLYRGFRIPPRDLVDWLAGDRLDRAKLLVERDLQVDVNGSPDTAINAARLAEKCPELRIVINHCGNLLIDGKEPARAWREGVAAAAKHPHVFCKVSALVEQTAEKPAPRTLDYYRPTLDHLWNCFGEERLVFGSNWPVSDRGAPFETVVALVRDYFNEKGTRAAERYFFENSKSAYAWPKR